MVELWTSKDYDVDVIMLDNENVIMKPPDANAIE